MMTASSAIRAGRAVASASDATTTDPIPSSLRVRMIRTATSPRLATRTFAINPDSGSRSADTYADGRGVEAVARVVDLRAVADDDKGVHAGLCLDPQPRRRDAVDDAERPV